MSVRRIATAVSVERLLAFLDRPIDALLIYLVATHGIVAGFVVGFVLEMAIVIAVLELHLRTAQRGFDVTGVELVREFIWSPVSEKASRLSRWVQEGLKAILRKTIGSYWLMIFVGSVVYIEPDYVTMLLRKENESRTSVLLRVALPASLWSIAVWIALFWAAIQGYRWAEISL